MKAWDFSGYAGRMAAQVIASLKGHIDEGRWDMEYEDGLLQYFRDAKVGHEKIGGLPWTEIDFPEGCDESGAGSSPAYRTTRSMQMTYEVRCVLRRELRPIRHGSRLPVSAEIRMTKDERRVRR